MALPATNNVSSTWIPAADPRQAQQDEPKKPPDNTAAKQSPKETQTAVKNTFGDAPKNDGKQSADTPKTSGDQPKLAVTTPKEDGTTPTGATDPKTSNQAADPPPAGGAKTPADPKNPPVADPKAAPGEPGSAVTDGAGAPVKTPDGKNVVYDQNKNPVPVNEDGAPYADPKGNSYAVHFTGKYRETVDGKTVVYAKALNGKAVALDDDGTFVSVDGNPKVVNPNGNYAKTVDGKEMVYPINSGGKIAALDSQQFQMFTGPQDTLYLVNPDGQYAIAEDGNYMVYGKKPDDKYLVASGGKILTDNQGNPYSLTADGKYMQPETGKFGVVAPYNKIVASDAVTGNVVKDANGNAYLLDDTGKYMQPETGKFAVYNEQIGKTVAADGNGNPVVDGNGNPYLVGNDGQYAKTADGNYDVYTPKVTLKDFVPVMDTSKSPEAPTKTSEGLYLYTDKNLTGKVVGVTNTGLVVEVDQTTHKMTTDPATGRPVVLNNPYAERPVEPWSISPEATLDSLPKGTGDGDPNQIKTELFKDGALDKESLYAAMGKYNALDVYDALMSSSKFGGWDKAPAPPLTSKITRPTEDQARALIAAMMAWQNQNGIYTPVKEGQVPFLGLVKDAFDAGAAFAFGHAAYINITGKSNKDPLNMMASAFHELNHVYTDPGFRETLHQAGEDDIVNGTNLEVVTEYLANQWSESMKDASYDIQPGMKIMDDVVKELGGGDLNAGKDLLKKAYFKGDPVAMQLFLAAAKKTRGENYTMPIFNPVDNDPTRPPVKPNQDPETTVKNLPQGTQKGDPMTIKDELFDANSNLDVDKLTEAAGKDDPRDIYDALINSGKHGGWDTMELTLKDGETLVHPNEEQAKQAIAAIVAWQNENGKYNPLKQGKVPSIIFYSGGKEAAGGRSADNIYVNVDNNPGVYLSTAIFHELNHSNASMPFKLAYSNLSAEGKASNEIITEYLANNWSGDKTDTRYERELYKEGFEALEEAVLKLGNGDRNTGLELLKRAYFAADTEALKQLLEYFPPKNYAAK